MTVRTALFLAIVVFAGTLGEISVTHAMKRIGELKSFHPRAVLRLLGRAFRSGWVWLGVGLMALAFYAFLALLSWAPVSFVIPASAMSYVVGTLGAKLLLREQVNRTRWAGVLLVCVGVALAWAGEEGATVNFPALLRGLRWAVLLLGVAPFVYYLLCTFSAWRYFRELRRRPAVLPGARAYTPPVSILKPVRGLDRESHENYASFCRQDYPEYEILFAVSDTEDPAIPVIQKIVADFPERSIRLLVGAEKLGASSKVCKLCRLVHEARYDLLVISDSDVRVGANYLRSVVEPFRDPQVGAVTTLFRGLVERQLGSEMDCVGSSAEFMAGALVAQQLEGIQFTLGATMATTRERLAEIGGFEALANHHSEDFELGKRIAARGYRIELAAEPVWLVFPRQSLRSYLSHELRWSIGLRHIRPWGHRGLVFTHGLPWSLAAAAVAPSAAVGAAYVGAYFLLRLLMAWTVGVWGLKDQVLLRRLWLLPVRDAIAALVWVASFASNRIQWRGTQFVIRDGILIPVHPPRSVEEVAIETSAPLVGAVDQSRIPD
ncbi:MAG: bacteriohopanetetrol glucosamine biosynthesis glycosyltransferase HpnI [Acidobacteria bacterium]|nr:bacteriohopanetetrol glucosamine biosynthesis glycosyltransferase HpnI [Acidobacteriota bacterium]